jgi:hypothetical protein
VSKARKAARGQECQIRLEGVCNGNPETTVLARFRMAGASGMGIKPPDWLGAWACSACHTAVDTHKDSQTQLDFAKGVFRTLMKSL